MKPPSGLSPAMGLLAALLVVMAGIAAALIHDDGPASTNTSVVDTIPRSSLPRSPTGSGPGPAKTPTSTLTTLLTTTTTGSTTSTTVKPAVPTPEAAANGLWAAYTSNDRNAATRFATADVIKALFSDQNTEPGQFQGCRQHSTGLYNCRYERPSLDYDMAAAADVSGSYKITGIQSSVRSTTTTGSTDTTSTSTTTTTTTLVPNAST